MTKKKRHVQFIPAGATLSPVFPRKAPSHEFHGRSNQNSNKRKARSKSVPPKSINQPVKKPPKTICNSRSLPWEDYEATWIFNRDIQEQAFKFLSTQNRLKENCFSSPPSRIIEKLKRTRIDSDKFAESKKTSFSSGTPQCDGTAQLTETSPNKFKQLLNLLKTRRNKMKCEPDDDKCSCDSCDGLLKCPTWCHSNLVFDDSTKEPPLFQSGLFKLEKTIMTKFDNKMLLHGPHIVPPVHSLDKTFLDEDIQKQLVKMDFAAPKHLQTYVWRAIHRGLNVMMVAPSKSGKTLGYLPVLCSFMTEEEKYENLSQFEGPLAVILCQSIRKCDDLQNLAKNLLALSRKKVTVEVLHEESVIENCDILISTPAILEECLKSGQVKLRRLAHLTIEDAHLVMRNESSSVSLIFKALNQIQINRPHKQKIQIIVASEKWSADLSVLLKQLTITPLVCFEDFLEAAIYSRILFTKKKINSEYKIFYLNDALKRNYMTRKTVVFIHEDDISKVTEYFQVCGLEYILLSSNLIEDEIIENVDMWNSLQSGHFRVLVCTDTVFDETDKILDANWLVHYWLPSDWSQFQKRFKCLSANLHSPLEVEEDHSRCSFMVLDEQCDNVLFSEFLDNYARNSVTHLRL